MGAVATSTAVQPVVLSFDNSGSLLLSLGANGSSQAPIAVVANSTGAAYGRTSLVVGDLYEVATTTASGINSPPTVLAPVVFVPGGLVEWPVLSLEVDAVGVRVFLALPGNGIVVIDESTAKTAYGQALTPQTATFIVGNASTSDSAEALNITPAGQPATGAFIVDRRRPGSRRLWQRGLHHVRHHVGDRRHHLCAAGRQRHRLRPEHDRRQNVLPRRHPGHGRQREPERRPQPPA